MNLTDSLEEAAFLAAVNDQPTDDLPRLIYADWLEEAGFAERAEQIRLQIALAQAKPWDAISIQHLRLDLGSYRRGFPWRMTVYDIPTLIRTLRSNAVPIGAIDIGTCPLNHWEELVALPEFQRIEEIRFTGLTLPIEPLRALRDAPNACNVTSLIFNRSNSLAFPEMIRELYLFPLGPQLKKLDIRFGQSGNEEDLFEAMTEHGQPVALEQFRYDGPLTLQRMNQRDGFLKVVRQVNRLELPKATLTGSGLELFFTQRLQQLKFLNLQEAVFQYDSEYPSISLQETKALRWIDLRGTYMDEHFYSSSWLSYLILPNLHVLRMNDTAMSLFNQNTRKGRSIRWLDLSTCRHLRRSHLKDLINHLSKNQLVRLSLLKDTVAPDDSKKMMSHFGPRLELIERSTGGIEI